jgi:phosphoglycolate phosphatase
MLTHSPRVLVFDFDGVLVDSNAVKQEAFRLIFEGVAVSSEFVSMCLQAQPEGNRFDVIRAMLERLRAERRIGDREPIEAQVQRYAEAYNHICEEHAATCPEIAGATERLTQWASRFAMYVNSATLEPPLRRVVARRGWAGFFRGVFGSPASKIDNLHTILKGDNLVPLNVLYVGDGARDLRAAQAIGCRFVGVRNPHNDFDPTGLTMITDLHGLNHLLTTEGAID